jgi:hypothetical protein
LTGDDKPLCDIWPGKGLLPTVRTLKISLLLLRPPPLVRLSLPPLLHLLRGTPRLPLSFVLPWSLSLHAPLSGRRLLSLRFPAPSFGGWPDLGLLSFCCFTLESDPASPTSAPFSFSFLFRSVLRHLPERSASHVIQNHSLGRETCCRLSPFHRWLWSVSLRSRSRTSSLPKAQARWPT